MLYKLHWIKLCKHIIIIKLYYPCNIKYILGKLSYNITDSGVVIK